MMRLDHEDDESSVSSTSTYYSYNSYSFEDGRDDEMWAIRGSDRSDTLQRVAHNSPLVTKLSVLLGEPFNREELIQLGRAVGGNSNVIVFRVIAGEGDFNDPVRSTEVHDAFCAGLAQNRSIQIFHTAGLDYTTGQIQTMSPFFSHNANLTEIKLRYSGLESRDIYLLAEAIKKRGENVKTIRSITYCSADASPSHISAIVELAKTCTHLMSLKLSHFRTSSDLSSCQVIASFLASEQCTLRKLNLNGNPINDAGCRIIAESLRINRRLRCLLCFNMEITTQGFASFIPVVCDASSIESTLNSNHTIEQVNPSGDKRVPLELVKLIFMNRDMDKTIVAKMKVLRSHFSGNFDLTAIAGLDAKALPYLLAWFGRLRRECSNFEEEQMYLSALYRITRHNPEICSHPSYNRRMRLKAKTGWRHWNMN